MDKLGNFSPLKKRVKHKNYSTKQFIRLKNNLEIDNYKTVDSGTNKSTLKCPLHTYSSLKLCSNYSFISFKNYIPKNQQTESDEQMMILKVKKNSIKISKLTENINEYEITNVEVLNESDSDYSDSEMDVILTNKDVLQSEDICESNKSINNDSTDIISNNLKKENDTKKLSILEDHIKTYYMSSKDNIPGYYDLYVTNCLKLISYLQPIDTYFETIKKIKNRHSFKFDLSKKLAILDLDETLIHSDLECNFICHDYYLETDAGVIPINFRPHLEAFLNFCENHFEIIIYTASCKEYADPILDLIEKDKKYFKYRLYREDCISYYNFFFKDLSIFERNENDVFIIDNCLFSFSYYLSNGILITSYFNDSEDSDLLSITEFLEKNVLDSTDLKNVIEETFNFTNIKNELSKIDLSN